MKKPELYNAPHADELCFFGGSAFVLWKDGIQGMNWIRKIKL